MVALSAQLGGTQEEKKSKQGGKNGILIQTSTQER